MTQVFINVCAEAGISTRMVERRFSSSVGEIGAFSFKKVISAVGLLARLTRAVPGARLCVFFVTNRTASLLVDLMLSEVLRVFRVPTIAYVHTLGFERIAGRGRTWNRLVKRLLHQPKAVICLSEKLAADVKEFTRPGAQIECIANTTPEVIEGSPSAEKDSLQVLYFSNYLPEKGISDFLAIAREMESDFPDVSFVAAGNPVSSEQLSALRAQATSNVRVVGPLRGVQKARAFEESVIMLFPSTYEFEAQPLAVIEAMSMGLVVVAYDVGGLSDVVLNGATGYLVQKGDVAGLKRNVVRVAADSELRRKLSEGARNAFERKHSRAAFARAWVDRIGAELD